MKSLNILLFLFYISLLFASAQTPNRAEIMPSTLMVKFLPSTMNTMKGSRMTSSSPLQRLFDEGNIISMIQSFPDATASNCLPKNKGNSKNVDLSTIYEITYAGSRDVREMISLFIKSGLIEYAEPKYIEKLQYTPNDPEAQPIVGKQYQLAIIKAYEAWDIEKGDSNVVIGIIDTDFNINHPDLKGQTKINIADPINGIDDDGDKYIDNYRGWDLANNDNDVTSKRAIVPNTTSGKNDTLLGNSHGTLVGGVAAAPVDNNIGIAGIGFKCKILPVKGMRDEDAGTGGISKGYEGIIYAAQHGVKVINCSWGSYDSYQRIAQDAINFATLNFDVLVVAAAGNEDAEKLLYPCSYENVLCVAGSGINAQGQDVKGGYTYSHLVDICAPSADIHGPYKDGYVTGGGSSYACPTVAGAAALVRTHFPKYNALQTLEQLRVTSDDIYSLPANKVYLEKLGKGRLNIFRALTETKSPAVRMISSNVPDLKSNIIYAGKTAKLTGIFRNFLATTSELKITVTCLSPFIVMVDSTISLGAIGTLDTVRNTANPFSFMVKKNIPINYQTEFRIGYSDGSYRDYQYVTATFNPDFITLDTNKIQLTITSNGRVGYRDEDRNGGVGLIYNKQSLLFESGLIVSTSQNKISNCIRSSPKGSTDLDFEPLRPPAFVRNSFSSQEGISIFKDTNRTRVGVKIIQNSYASPEVPNDKFAIVRYLVTNTSDANIDSLRVGIFTDWDIQTTETSNRNRADFDAGSVLAFTYRPVTNGLYAGVALLSGEPVSVFSHEPNSSLVSNINPNDGFTPEEKMLVLSRGIQRTKAGSSGLGADVMQTIGGVTLNVKPNETRQMAFAFIAGDSKTDVVASAIAARNLYNNSIRPTSIVGNEQTMQVEIYPNPTKESVTIAIPKITDPLVIRIENTLGASLGSQVMTSSPSVIDLKELPSGIYFFKIDLGQSTMVRKIIKE